MLYVQLLLFFSLSRVVISFAVKKTKKVQRHLNLQFGDMNAKRLAAAAAIYGSLFCAGVDWRPRLSPGAIDV
jgi:hypothetical protein